MAAADFDYDIRKAVTDQATAALAALTPAVPFYDHPPQDAAFPYVTLDRVVGTNADILAATVVSFLFYFTVWSRARGHAQVQRIVGTLRDAMNQVEPLPASGHLIQCRVTRVDVVRDADGVTYQGSVELVVDANP